jgi:hypothetical protein
LRENCTQFILENIKVVSNNVFFKKQMDENPERMPELIIPILQKAANQMPENAKKRLRLSAGA